MVLIGRPTGRAHRRCSGHFSTLYSLHVIQRRLNKRATNVAAHPNNTGSVTLLGYVTFYSEGPGAAYPTLKRAARLDRNSYFIPKLHKLARIAGGMEKKPPPPVKAEPLRNTRHQGRQTETKTLQTRA